MNRKLNRTAIVTASVLGVVVGGGVAAQAGGSLSTSPPAVYANAGAGPTYVSTNSTILLTKSLPAGNWLVSVNGTLHTATETQGDIEGQCKIGPSGYSTFVQMPSAQRHITGPGPHDFNLSESSEHFAVEQPISVPAAGMTVSLQCSAGIGGASGTAAVFANDYTLTATQIGTIN